MTGKKSHPALRRTFRACTNAALFALVIVGLAGIPEDLVTWQEWIDRAMYDPQVTMLAERAVAVAQFVNQPWLRILLVIVAVSLLFWGARPFWSLRHKLWFLGKRIVSDQTWVDEQAAYRIVTDSEWARIREPFVGIFDNLAVFGRGGISPQMRKTRQFAHYCRLTLKSFAKNNPSAVRDNNGREYEEVKLRQFLREALDEEVLQEFGDIPDITVPDEG